MKVVASDFDNTLFVKDKDIFSNNLEMVKRFVDSGNTFIIITGRSYSNIAKVIEQYNISYNYLICQDGASIFDSNGNCLNKTLLDSEKSLAITKYLDSRGINYEYQSPYNDKDVLENAVKIIITISDREEASKLNVEIKNLVDVYSYVSTEHINITDISITKAKAIKYLEDNGLISDNITVIGDDINDFEMLSKYDGVIMKKHYKILDELGKEEINSVGEYLENLI